MTGTVEDPDDVNAHLSSDGASGSMITPRHALNIYCWLVFVSVLQHSAMILLRQTRCALSRRCHIAYFHASPAWWAARKVLQRFKLADIGEGITECEVIRWYVSTPHYGKCDCIIIIII